MTTTVGRWIDLPTSGGAADPFRADEPGGAGLFQIAASNATLGARENGLRPLWEDFGSSDVTRDLFIAGDPSTFLWGSEDSDGCYVRFAGTFRVRLFGEGARVPRLRFTARALAPLGYETGLILAVSRGAEPPTMAGGTYTSTTTNSTSLTPLVLELSLTAEDLAAEALSLQSGGGAVDEAGQHTTLGVWVGAWCTSGGGASKGALYGASLLLREPA